MKNLRTFFVKIFFLLDLYFLKMPCYICKFDKICFTCDMCEKEFCSGNILLVGKISFALLK